MRLWVQALSLLSGLRIWCYCELGVGHRCGLDLELWLWLWLAAVAPIQPLAWEPPYAQCAALKKQKKKPLKQRPPRLGNASMCQESGKSQTPQRQKLLHSGYFQTLPYVLLQLTVHVYPL